MERDGKLMFLLLSDIVSWKEVTSSFSKQETVCAIWMLKIVIKKKKKNFLYNICLSLAQTDKKLVSPM